MIEDDKQVANINTAVKAGTGKSNPVFDSILEAHLTQEEKKTMAKLATLNITGGEIYADANEHNLDPDLLALLQHKIGVNPVFTGVVDLGDGNHLFTHKNQSTTTVAKALPNDLSNVEKLQVAGLLGHDKEIKL